MNHDLVKKIRKLLKLAKSSGPEAEIAAERAQRLMEAHGITVTAEEIIRIEVPGADEFWSSQLLVAVSQQHRCKIMSSTQGSGAVIAGERSDAEEASARYRWFRIELVYKCASAWGKFIKYRDYWADKRDDYLSTEDLQWLARGESDIKIDYDDDDDDEYGDDDEYDRPIAVGDDSWVDIVGYVRSRRPERRPERRPPRTQEPRAEFDHVQVRAAFFRVYLDSAAISVAKRLTPIKEAEPPPPPPDISTPAQQRQKKLTAQDENDSVLEHLKQLNKILGEARVRELQQNAQRDGVYAGRELRITPLTRKMLTADGSIPKPEPNRFSYLDF